MDIFDDIKTDDKLKFSEPVKELKDKWKLLPAFLQVNGLVKQHTDNYDYFLKIGLKRIIETNSKINSDNNANFYLKYLDIHVGMFN